MNRHGYRPKKMLIGQTFGRLTVTLFAGVKGEHSYWCCKCRCGNGVKVRGTKLLTGRQISCGCARADSSIRRNAAMKIPARKRVARAVKGGMASAQKSNPPGYKLDLWKTAEIIGASEDRVRTLCDTGILASIRRKGQLLISARDVEAYVHDQQIKPVNRCDGGRTA